MTDTAIEFATIQLLHPNASLHAEGTQPAVFLPNFKFRAAAGPCKWRFCCIPRRTVVMLPGSFSNISLRALARVATGRSTPSSAANGGHLPGKMLWPISRGLACWAPICAPSHDCPFQNYAPAAGDQSGGTLKGLTPLRTNALDSFRRACHRQKTTSGFLRVAIAR